MTLLTQQQVTALYQSGLVPSTQTITTSTDSTTLTGAQAAVLANLTQQQTSAYERLRLLFQTYGLPDANDILDVIQQGVLNGEGDDIIQLKLQDTASWKQRFQGNEIRKANHENVLSIAEYLQQEDQYRAILRNAGLPVGFYDDYNDFANLIGGGVSVAELQDRVNLASDIVNREDQSILDQLSSRGITKAMLLAHALDPERAAPLIKKEQNSILVGAAASRAGLNVGQSISDRLAERGIGEAQAVQGFGQINDFLSTTEKEGQIYGEDYGVEDAVGEVFEGGSGQKRKRLHGTERANFSGSSDYGIQRRDTSGSY